MGIVKLQCKSCGAKLPHNNIETDIYGNSKVQCEYCGIFTVLSRARVAKKFNIDLEELANKDKERRRQDIKFNMESVGDFLAELSKF